MEVRGESYNREHQAIAIDLAQHVLQIDRVAVGALIGMRGEER